MKLKVLSPKEVLFDGDAHSIFLPGDLAEFEILDYHAPIISLLRQGDIVVDHSRTIPIWRGIVKFDRNECTILVEEEVAHAQAAAVIK
jgi:F-type H+-transporting ATPase subunit epsilon